MLKLEVTILAEQVEHIIVDGHIIWPSIYMTKSDATFLIEIGLTGSLS